MGRADLTIPDPAWARESRARAMMFERARESEREIRSLSFRRCASARGAVRLARPCHSWHGIRTRADGVLKPSLVVFGGLAPSRSTSGVSPRRRRPRPRASTRVRSSAGWSRRCPKTVLRLRADIWARRRPWRAKSGFRSPPRARSFSCCYHNIISYGYIHTRASARAGGRFRTPRVDASVSSVDAHVSSVLRASVLRGCLMRTLH